MDNRFVILHLSDIHLSERGEDLSQSIVCTSLLNDVAMMHEDHSLTPNLVVFSGDVIKGCHPSCDLKTCIKGGENPECKIGRQLAKAKLFIERVVEKAGAGIAEDFPLLIVPGNHDVNRHRVAKDFSLARKAYGEAHVDAIQKDTDTTWPPIIKRQQQWYDVVRGIPNFLQWDDRFYVPSGIVTFRDTRIGIAGLNSSWGSCDDDDKGHLWIGRYQFDYMHQKIEGADFKIVATHHPCSWLASVEESEKESKIESKYHVYLHGHRHRKWFYDSRGHLRIEAGAGYAGPGEANAYSWTALDFSAKRGTIWLRVYSDDGEGGWIPGSVPGKTESDGQAQIEALFLDKGSTAIACPGGRDQNPKAFAGTPVAPSESTIDLINQLESRFKVSWVPHLFAVEAAHTQVFWPVRLRYPTPIHASQCFIAAAMQKVGSSINLYIDDFGKDHAKNDFMNKFKAWFSKVGGDFDSVLIKNYSTIEIEDEFRKLKRETLEKLLLTQIVSFRRG